MHIAAQVRNSQGSHAVVLRTNGREQLLTVSPKPEGFGSSVNGGELLFLALATCYCNDIYREAAKRKIRVVRVEVSVEGEFGAEGEAARNVTYAAKVEAEAQEDEIERLMTHTDALAEIQNTLRKGVPVTFTRLQAKRA
jgi:uncharacterized OsmC-like protein